MLNTTLMNGAKAKQKAFSLLGAASLLFFLQAQPACGSDAPEMQDLHAIAKEIQKYKAQYEKASDEMVRLNKQIGRELATGLPNTASWDAMKLTMKEHDDASKKAMDAQTMLIKELDLMGQKKDAIVSKISNAAEKLKKAKEIDAIYAQYNKETR